jgi:Ca2+-binding EF-hand superfamily protein
MLSSVLCLPGCLKGAVEVLVIAIRCTLCSSDTGSLSLEEFIRLVGNLGLKSGPEIEQEFEDALRFFDKDGRGLIEADQLKAALQTCGEPLEDDDIVELMKLADVKGDGKIDYLGVLHVAFCFVHTNSQRYSC